MKQLFFLICLICGSVFMSYAQEAACGTTENTSSSEQLGGKYITSVGTFKMLIVFVEFLGDKTDTSNAQWPYSSPPTFLNTVIDST